MERRWRRRPRTTLALPVALGLVLTAARTLATDSDDVAPGRVTAASAGSNGVLDPSILTTSCGSLCSAVTNAQLCLGLNVDSATCEATRQSPGATCVDSPASSPSSSVLCLSPADATRWSLQLTADAELLALATSGLATASGAAAIVIALNASDVRAVEDFALPADATQLTLRAADDAERLGVAIGESVIAAWQSLEQLSIRDFDLSAVTALPSFARLGSLDLSRCRLRTWSTGATPALSVLDLSSNELPSLPEGSLPSSLNVLNVSSNNLVELPADIASLSALYQLSLSNNNFAQMTEFPKLPALQELYLSSAGLSAVPPGIANLPILQVLDLSHNNLASSVSSAFPASLITLKLRDCRLQILPGDFGIEKTWQSIDLSENPFSDGAFSGVTLRAKNLVLEQVRLTRLSANVKSWAIGNALSLSKNALGSVDAADLPSDIAELRLANCFLTDVPASLPSLRRLSILDLSNNTIGPITIGSLPPTLAELYLAGCGLGTVPTDVEAMGGTLQVLDLSANNLTEVELKNFVGLQSLDLHENALTSIPPDVFTMANLSSLDLRGNPITNVTLTANEIAFLSTKLRTFEIDASAFAVPGECIKSVVLRGKYTLCTQVAPNGDTIEPIATTDAPPPGAVPTPSPTMNSSTTTSNATLNIVLGCAVAAVMVVSVLVARMPKPRCSNVEHASSYDPLATAAHRYGPIDMWDDPELLRWRVDILDVELVMQIGIGANSVLWLARYQTDTVVVKRLFHKRGDPRAFERFIEEIKFLGRLVHENIVLFIGVSWTSDSDLQMLLEFMAHGDLHKYLTTSRGDAAARAWGPRKIRIALDMAEALTYLHSHDPTLLHRDLRSHHVLLDEDYTAKLTDFGMCRHRASDLDLSVVSGASSRSIAPEVLAGRGSHGKAVDMYAFGVVLAELDGHELPFSDITLSSGAPLSEMAMLELLSTGALQPSLTPDCPPDIARLIADCLSFDAARRPSASVALRRLHVVMDSFEVLGGAAHHEFDDSAGLHVAGSYLDAEHGEEEDDEHDDGESYRT